MLHHQSRLKATLRGFQIGRDMHRLDFQRLAKIVASHDAANCAGVRIARRMFGSRILAVENSTKRLAASRSEANSSDSSGSANLSLIQPRPSLFSIARSCIITTFIIHDQKTFHLEKGRCEIRSNGNFALTRANQLAVALLHRPQTLR